MVWAQFAPEPPFASSSLRVTGAKRQGLNYEKRAQAYVEMQLAQKRISNPDLEYMKSPWLCFKALGNNGRTSYCQPDGLILDLAERHCVIVEIKLQHTAEAYWQVRKLYQPVLQVIYPTFTFSALEIVKWLDPHIKFPEAFKFAEDIWYNDQVKFGVHIFNSGR